MTKARTNADNASADIQGVTAGTGLSGGGTSGTVTLTNDMATTIDAKGDLVVGTGADTYSRLATGNAGETLVADSSTSTGLRWQGDYAAGKNKLLNGDFFINQRNFSSSTTNNDYGFDRWKFGCSDGTVTYSAQTFTPGSAPVAGYEARNFARINTTGQTLSSANATFRQPIEDVRNFAGQTATLSFWAKSASGTPKIAIEIQQAFGDSGSPSASVNTYAGQVTISTTWTRYSITVAVPSISGKTLGTTPNSSQISPIFWLSAGSNFDSRTGTLGIQTNTFDIWGVQFEAGSVATAFQTATGTLAGELAACQRYYHRTSCASVGYQRFSTAVGANSTTVAYPIIPLPVTLRALPTSIDYSLTGLVLNDGGTNTYAVTGLTIDSSTGANLVSLTATVASGLTQFRPYYLNANNSSSPYIGFSAEL